MKKIIIKKTEDEETYKKTTTTMTFEVNGKEVKVYEHSYYDDASGDQDYDTEIDESDKEALTEEEAEIFSDEMYDCLRLKVGELKEVDGYEE